MAALQSPKLSVGVRVPGGTPVLNASMVKFGRHKRLKISRRKVSRFDPGYSHQVVRRRSINGDAVDCKSAAFGHDWFDPSILHQSNWRGPIMVLEQIANLSVV